MQADTCDAQARSLGKSPPRRPWTMILPTAVFAAASLGPGCASDGSSPNHAGRKDAIQRCVESVPVDASRYEDRFAACMERYGWVYAPKRG